MARIDVLHRMDRNKNGYLESDEILEPTRGFITLLIKSHDAHEACDKQTGRIDLHLLQSLVQEHLKKPASEDPPRTPKLSNRESLQYAARLISNYDTNDNQRLDAGEFQMLSDAWVKCDLNSDLHLDVVEVATGLKYVLNFPKNPDGTYDHQATGQDQESLSKIYDQLKSEHAQEANKPLENEVDNSRQYAERLMISFDVNRNGSLDLSELKKLGPTWSKADFDKNGQVTVDEIQVRFQHFHEKRIADTKRESAQGPISASRATSEPTLKPVDAATQKRVQRIGNLPDGFVRLDADANGQIEMHEFAEKFNASVIRDFYARDTSHDGVITLNEWNRFLVIRNQESARPSTSLENDLDRR